MPGRVIGRKINCGFAGTVARNPDNIILAKTLNEASPAVNFGEAIALNSDNTAARITAANQAKFIGFAVREVKQSTEYSNSASGYNPLDTIDILTRGNMTVFCNNGTPTAGGDVYLRVTSNPAIPNGVIGQVEAAADGANTILLENVKFTTGNIDGNNITEISILTRNI